MHLKAILTVFNRLPDNNISFQYLYESCYNCLFINTTVNVGHNKTVNLLLNVLVRLLIRTNETICNYEFKTQPGLSYKYLIQKPVMDSVRLNNTSTRPNCTLMYDSKNLYDYLLPLYILFIILCFCLAVYYTILMLYRHRVFQKLGSRLFLYQVDLYEDFGRPGAISSIASDNEYPSTVETRMKSSTDRRLKGLDCFRGMSVLLMVFVNYGGGGYWFFEHSTWNGIYLADLVFPWFVFVMGVTLAICLFRSINNDSSKFYWLKTWLLGCKRTVILFIIGVGLESPACNRNVENLRIMGPLQRLAIGYFCLITSICVISPLQARCKGNHPLLDDTELLNNTTDINSAPKESCKCRNVFTDICFCLPYILIAFGLLLAHACISLLVVVPGCPVGYLGPGGIGDKGCCRNCSGGVAGYIDRIVMTPQHMYQTPTSKTLYLTDQPFDPEGILGYLSCTALCFLGFWAGNVILRNNNWSGAVKRLLIYAVICTAIGVGLCEAKTNGGLIPINKNLWSVSYVLISAGTSFFLLAFMFTTVDVLKLWNGSPFHYVGMNPIVIYCGHMILRDIFPIQWNVALTYTLQLIMSVWGTVFWAGIGYIMFKKKMFLTV